MLGTYSHLLPHSDGEAARIVAAALDPDPVKLPTPQEVHDGLREHYATHSLYPPRTRRAAARR